MTRSARLALGLLLAAALTAIAACKVFAPTAAPPAEEVARFVSSVNDTMLKLGREQQQAAWVAATYITPDTEAISARADQTFIDAVARNARDAARLNAQDVPPDVRRQLDVLKTTLVVVTPSDEKQAGELTALNAAMKAAYGARQVVRRPGAAGDVPRHRADHRGDGHLARPEAPARGVGRLAHDRGADAQGLRAVRDARQRRRARAGLRRHRRAVAREVRHAARRRSRASSIGCGSRCGRSTCRCTPTCG